MDPSTAIFSIERSLRSIVSERLPAWMNQLTARDRRRIESSRQSERDNREGAQPSEDLIDFTYTGQLANLVLDNWPVFAPVFGDEEIMRGLLRYVSAVRNAPAHSRDLLQHERDLLAGTAGRISNQIGMWRARNGSETQHYPRIESVVDRFGSTGWADNPVRYDTTPLPALEVGDELRWECRAIPSARSFAPQWLVVTDRGFFLPGPAMMHLPLARAQGETATLALTVTSEMVGNDRVFGVILRTSSAHHRDSRGYDDARFFCYRVAPPLDE